MLNLKSKVLKHCGRALLRMAGDGAQRPAKATPTEDFYLNLSHGYDDEEAAKAAIRRVRGNTMTSMERLVSLWNQVRYVDRYAVPGALVECGVWRGGSMGVMALAHMASAPKSQRQLHLFDSFEGLPEPDSKVDGTKATVYSGQADSGALNTIGKCVGPLEDNEQLLFSDIRYPKEKVVFHKGWFEQTVPSQAASVGPIAVLRLDGDWYSSTKVCLEHLYPLVSPNGIVVIDDYGHWEGCKKAVDEFLLERKAEPVMLNHIDYTGRYWVKTQA